MQNNNKNNEIFFKIWRNVIIKNEIIFHLRLYNRHLNKVFSFNIDKIRKYKYHSYLNKIEVYRDHEMTNELLSSIPYGVGDVKIVENGFMFSKFNETTIPMSVHTLRLGDGYSENINKSNVIPPSVTVVEFGYYHTEILIKICDILPSTVNTIRIRGSYNGPFELGCNTLPFSVKSIEFSDLIKDQMKLSDLQYYQSKSIESLKFENDFNEIIKENQIPNSITSIIFGKSFNCLIAANSLPINLSSIEFGKKFNKPFDFSSLINLKTINFSFSSNFDQSFDDFKLPPYLKSLKFGPSFNRPIPINILPTTLTSLNLCSSMYFDEFCISLNQLKSLKLGRNFIGPIKKGQLPNSIKSLTFGDSFNCSVDKDILPNKLKTLHFGNNFSKQIVKETFPSTLTTLSFGNDFDQIIEKQVLPNNLKNLSFGSKYNQSIGKDVLPCNLLTLILGRNFNKTIEKDILSCNLTTLCFGTKFDNVIGKDILPNSLTSLSFGLLYNKRIEIGTLPNSITFLSFGISYNQHFPVGSLPTSLKELEIRSNKFNQDFSSSFDDYFTSSLESIYINENSNLVNILNSNFFFKFIKYKDFLFL